MHNTNIPLYTIVPFILLLGSIALFPIFGQRFWHKNKNKLFVAIILSLPVSAWLIINGMELRLLESILFDYLPFIILIGSLYIITGGIFLDGDIEAKPSVNVLFLGIGALLASFMGTTGAAMLLIRPLIQTNKARKFKTHTILFFIGIVANCGGLLTPLGDPPLFLMYLHGASFTWFSKLFLEWLFTNGLLLIIYFFVDNYYHKKEPIENLINDKNFIRPLRLNGRLNFLWLTGVILAIAFINGQYIFNILPAHYLSFIRDGVILLMALLSLFLTPLHLREANNFNWLPVEEVTYLFLGIFVTMVPCLLYLESNAAILGVTTPFQFYYYSGLLSSFLDSAPAAVTFHSLALGLNLNSGNMITGIAEELLRAICLGTVFFGAVTYIGNVPNFMIKAVAENNNIQMPHFFNYIFKFSLIVLLPVFILVQLIFLSF
ncbi:MAG: sodium:proton antiporter [Ignavibacteriaceae bacterium]|nr:sodium:proton antiporter [Ignavibacteriaceae bacterium]